MLLHSMDVFGRNIILAQGKLNQKLLRIHLVGKKYIQETENLITTIKNISNGNTTIANPLPGVSPALGLINCILVGLILISLAIFIIMVLVMGR